MRSADRFHVAMVRVEAEPSRQHLGVVNAASERAVEGVEVVQKALDLHSRAVLEGPGLRRGFGGNHLALCEVRGVNVGRESEAGGAFQEGQLGDHLLREAFGDLAQLDALRVAWTGKAWVQSAT